MAVGSPIKRFLASPRRAGAFFLLLMALVSVLVLPAPGWALGEAAADEVDDASAADGQSGAADPSQHSDSRHDTAAGAPARRYGPPGAIPGVPSPAELESAGAVIGKVLVDNQNIFNLEDPKDNNWLFRLGNDLHPKTRAEVIRHQLLFKPGDRYSRHVVDESERILRADGYFYDAWIREVRYEDNHVDLRVTTRDVWTLNPGFNFSRSGGTNSVGVQLEDTNFLGSGASLKVFHTNDVDRTTTGVQASDEHAFGWISTALTFSNNSDGYLRELSVQQPFYALNTHWAAGGYGINDLQTDSLYDRGVIIDRFRDQHQGAQLFGGWSSGVQNGWVRRWTTGFTYDEHNFEPVPWSGPSVAPVDRRFLYPFVQFDLIQDDFLRLWNHDQIGRTEDFYLGTSLSAQAGYAEKALGSSTSALLFRSYASTGFGGNGRRSTLLLFWDFSGRVASGALSNGIMDGSVRYYNEQSKNWLFFTTLSGTKGWRLDLDNQITLGGDNGLRGYPLRYQDGTARALFTIEQRYFTDWYPFRLFRVGGAVFFDAGRTWGRPPLAAPGLGLLSDAGFGLRFGNSRSGLGNVIHVDLAFPFNGDPTINKVQFLVQTEHSF
jgi:surface antigen-like variable number repeat protein